jgi:hypothetical protein
LTNSNNHIYIYIYECAYVQLATSVKGNISEFHHSVLLNLQTLEVPTSRAPAVYTTPALVWLTRQSSKVIEHVCGARPGPVGATVPGFCNTLTNRIRTVVLVKVFYPVKGSTIHCLSKTQLRFKNLKSKVLGLTAADMDFHFSPPAFPTFNHMIQ